jgi:hypothetical protein
MARTASISYAPNNAALALVGDFNGRALAKIKSI